jgi:hypothetical protein
MELEMSDNHEKPKEPRNPLYVLVAYLEGRAAQLDNESRAMKKLAEALMKTQGQPAEQRTLISDAMVMLQAYALTLPKEEVKEEEV